MAYTNDLSKEEFSKDYQEGLNYLESKDDKSFGKPKYRNSIFPLNQATNRIDVGE